MPKKTGEYKGDLETYRKKLAKVMKRLGVPESDYRLYTSKSEVKIEFTVGGEKHEFYHSIEKARAHGFDYAFPFQILAQVVYTLEDLARASERGIYTFATLTQGLIQLPHIELPSFLKEMGFQTIPMNAGQVSAKYRDLCKVMHPDNGGSPGDFIRLQANYERAMKFVEAGGR